MNIELMMVITGVLVVIAAVLFFISRFPRRIIRRELVCPEKGMPASVSFLRKETSFGTLGVTDVIACTLFEDGQIGCEKHCMGHRS